MTEQIIEISDIATALDITPRATRNRAKAEKWPTTDKKIRGGGNTYPVEKLPEYVRDALAELNQSPAAKAGAQEGEKLKIAAEAIAKIEHRHAEDKLKSSSTLTEREREREVARLAVLEDWDSYRATSGKSVRKSAKDYAELYNAGMRDIRDIVSEFVPKVSGRTLERWKATLQKQGHLGAKYGNRKGSSKIDNQSDLREFVVAMITRYPHCNPQHVMAGLKARFDGQEGIELPSEGRLRVWMDNWKSDNAQLFSAMTNPDAWKNTYMTAFGSSSEDIIALNQLWEFDGTPADVMLVDGRHCICGVIDVYSRRPIVIVSKTAKSSIVTALLRRAILTWGVPDIAKTDNGSDYVSHHTKRVYRDLDIEQKLCPPFSPWHKPHIERFFRSMSHGIVELLPGFIGHNVPERKAIEARKQFSERLFKKDQVVEINMTSGELQSFLDDWIDNIYMHKKHSSINKTPYQMVSEWTKPVRRISDTRALDILLQPTPGKDGIRVVGKSGLRVDHGDYIASELGLHVGQSVRVLEVADDLGSLVIYGGDEFNEFICVARCPERSGISRAEVAAKAKEIQKKHIQEAKRNLKSAAKKVNTSTIVNEIMQHAANSAEKLISFPRASDTHTSPALEASAQAAAAMDGHVETTPKVDRAEFLRKALEKIENEEAAKGVEVQEKRIDQMSNEELYQHWKRLEAKVQKGEMLEEADSRFHAQFPTTPEFSTQQMMEEEFAEFYQAQ